MKAACMLVYSGGGVMVRTLLILVVMAMVPAPLKASTLSRGITLTAVGGGLLGLGLLNAADAGSDSHAGEDCHENSADQSAEDRCVREKRETLYALAAVGGIAVAFGIPMIIRGARE